MTLEEFQAVTQTLSRMIGRGMPILDSMNEYWALGLAFEQAGVERRKLSFRHLIPSGPYEVAAGDIARYFLPSGTGCEPWGRFPAEATLTDVLDKICASSQAKIIYVEGIWTYARPAAIPLFTNWTPVLESVRQYMACLRGKKFFEHRANYEHDIFEKAVEAVYGSGVWEGEINPILRRAE